MTSQQDLMVLAQRWQDEAAASWGETKEHATLQRCCDELREAAAQLGRVDDIPFATVERVCKALIRMGRSVPGGKEERAARVVELVGWLCEEVLANRPQLPAGVPEYDRELIAEMLQDICYGMKARSTFTVESIKAQIDALRAADNRDAEGVHTAKREDGVPDGFVLVPRELPESWQEAMCEAHEFSGFHDLMGPMGVAYAKLIELAAAPQPDNKESR